MFYLSTKSYGKGRRTRKTYTRPGKFARGNRRSSGLYRLSTKSIGRKRGGVRPELKYFNNTFANDTCVQMNAALDPGPGPNNSFNGNDDPNKWYILATEGSLCRIKQGAGPDERIGRKVCLKSLFMRWRLKEGTNDQTDPMGGGARILILLDTQSNGTLPTAEDVFQTSGYKTTSNIKTGGVQNAQYLMNISNSQRFRVLYDKHILINSPSLATYSTAPAAAGMHRAFKEKYWSKYIKLPSIDIEMGNTGQEVGICKSNQIHCCVCPSGGPIFITGVFRVRFTDV